MKRIASIIFAMILLMTSVYVSSCKGKNDKETTPNDGVVSETNDAQNQFDDILKITEDAINTSGQSGSRTTAYPAITLVPGSGTTGTITVDYGTDGLTASNDGKIRKGKLVITYTDKYRNTGAVITTTTKSYFVGDKEIRARRIVTNDGNYSYTVQDLDSMGVVGSYAQIVYNDGTDVKWKSTRTRKWTAGYSTIGTLTDDVYTINGSAEGYTIDYKDFTMNITNLIVRLECYYSYIYMPSGGTIDIIAGEKTRSINYGNGSSCDRDVIYTINGKSYELSL